MLRALAVAVAACGLLALPAGAQAAEFRDAFNTDAQGWTTGQSWSRPFDSGSGPAAMHNPSGNYISVVDNAVETCMDMFSPPPADCNFAYFRSATSSWTADHSAEYGGSLSLDLLMPAEVDPETGGPVVVLRGASSYLYLYFPQTPVQGWNTYRARFSPGLQGSVAEGFFGWGICLNGNVPPSENCDDPTQAEFQAVIAGMTSIEVVVDLVPGTTETYGLDNVGLSATPHDGDGDGHPDVGDNCFGDPNPDQLNTDGDFVGNACDFDDDGDGREDFEDACPLAPAATADGCPLPPPATTPTAPAAPKKCKKGQKLKKGKCVKKKRKKKK